MPTQLPNHLQPGSNQRLFAWNGIAFLTPKSWELAQAKLFKGVTTIMLEDSHGPRLEVDWFATDGKVSADKVQKRCQKQSGELSDKAVEVLEITGLDRDWTAHIYVMPEAKALVVGYCLPSADGRPFAFFRLHFVSDYNESPAVIFRALAKSFSWWKNGLAPWAFYDIQFFLNRDFHLANTALQAGRKMLSFEWRFRRLFIWYFSLADYILRQQTADQWCCDFLNGFSMLPVPRWYLDEQGKLTYRRKKIFFLGQFEEIGRFCFRYQAVCRHLPESNQIVLWVVHYRNPADLSRLAENFSSSDDNLSSAASISP